MINLAVLNLRDIGKYLIKIVVILLILFCCSKIVLNIDIKRITMAIKIDDEKLLKCIDDNIPGINQLKDEEEIVKIQSRISMTNPLKMILESQIGMINSVVKNSEIGNNKKIENSDKEEKEQIEIEKAEVGLATKVIENSVPNKYTNTYDTVQIKNGTDYNLTEEMLKPDIDVNNKKIIIFHTHTCESYTPTQEYNYEQTGTYRTTDLNYNVTRVGTELERQLKAYNYDVIHDTTYHDYPAYTGSYDRSLNTVRNILANNNDADVIFDIHRDAIANYSYAPTVKIGEEYAAQLMFVIGTDGGGLDHPNWNQNLKFAIKIQQEANKLYPGLFKPIILRNSRYNQHLAKGASIIEVGATGNTMEQCLVSMKYLAKVISEVLK